MTRRSRLAASAVERSSRIRALWVCANGGPQRHIVSSIQANWIIIANLSLVVLALLSQISPNTAAESSGSLLDPKPEMWVLMSANLAQIYGKLFAKKDFYRLNKFLYRCAIQGLGCVHYQNLRVSGEEAFLHSFIPNQDGPLIVFDVGAYHGEYAKLVRRYSPKAQIYCFEPHPRSYERLRNVAQRHDLIALNLACAERSRKAHLFDLADGDGSLFASLYREMLDLHLGKPCRSHEVDVVSIDEFARNRGIERINLLKIDVEGAELEALHGARGLIKDRRIDAVQFEFSSRFVLRRTFVRDFCETLVGYKFFRLLPNELLPLGSYSVANYELFHYQNLVALLHEGEPQELLGTGRARLRIPQHHQACSN